MYQKYHTDALVLGGRENAEADRTIFLFTRDFGLLYGRASAIRKEKSKMRYALANYSFAEVSLVRGKSGWRIVGARAISGTQGKDQEALMAFARIALLVTRFVTGEEPSATLFDILRDARSALFQERCEAWATIELVCVARVLYVLGYISNEALQSALLTHTAYADEHLREAELVRDELLSSINRAISETQL